MCNRPNLDSAKHSSELEPEQASIRIDLLNANADVQALFDDDRVHETLATIRKAVGDPRAIIALRTPRAPQWRLYDAD